MRARVIKIILTVGLLIGLGTLLDWGLVFRTIVQARLEWIAVAALCVALARMVIAWRWQTILRSTGQRYGFGRLLRVVSAGIGLGSLLPTSVGPDLARGVLLHTDSARDDTAMGAGLLVSSLVLDRYAATLGTLGVACLGALAIGQMAIAASLAVVFILAMVTAAAISRFSTPLIKVITPGPLRKFAPKLEGMAGYLRKPEVVWAGLIPGTLISAVLAVVRTCVFIALYRAFGFVVPIDISLFVVPVMLIALMAPVTIGGFGLREWLLTVGFADVGVPPEVSVSVGLLAFAVQILVSVPAIAQTILATRAIPGLRRGSKEEVS